LDAAFELQKLLTSSLPSYGIVSAIHAGGWVSIATSVGLRQMRADISLVVGDSVLLSGDRIVGMRTASPQQIYYV
jgi:hypothetical protein